MEIPLNQFEIVIDETILERGFSYFEKGRVHEPEVLRSGVYEFIVDGTQSYTVQLTLKNGIVTKHSCTCPFDKGPVCKHVAAAIFHLVKDDLELPQKKTTKKKNTAPKRPKKKTIQEQTNDLLSMASHEELVRFISDIVETNPTMRNRLFSYLAHYSPDESKEFYLKQLKSMLREISGPYDFFDFLAANKAGKEARSIFDLAQKQISNGNLQSAIFICTALMEQLIVALKRADDRSGQIGQCISDALKLLEEIATSSPQESIKQQVIDFCINSFEKGIFNDWDWHFNVLSVGSKLITTEKEAANLIGIIDKAPLSGIELFVVQIIKLDIIERFYGEDAGNEYIMKNLSNPHFREQAIENALVARDFHLAISLANDGIKEVASQKILRTYKWHDWLLMTAIEMDDAEKSIEYARMLYINNWKPTLDYLQILQDFVAPEEWPSFLDGLVKEIIKLDSYHSTELVANIFIRERQWGKLFELVKSKPSISNIETYEEYLAEGYSTELAKLIEAHIWKEMQYFTSRNQYRQACRYILWIKKLGALDVAESLIANLRSKYPQRKALIDELNRI